LCKNNVRLLKLFLMWVDLGRPRFGYYFDIMKRTHALLKLTLRHGKTNTEELEADACAESLLGKSSHRPPKFWNNVYKIGNNKAIVMLVVEVLQLPLLVYGRNISKSSVRVETKYIVLSLQINCSLCFLMQLKIIRFSMSHL